MRAHRITVAEAGDFARPHSPRAQVVTTELFPDTNLAYEDDVEALAYAIHQREEAAPGSTSIVSLVALQHQLEQAVPAGAGMGDARPRARKQQMALAWVRSVAGRRHWREAERPAQAAALFARNCQLLDACYGTRGVPPDLSVLGSGVASSTQLARRAAASGERAGSVEGPVRGVRGGLGG